MAESFRETIDARSPSKSRPRYVSAGEMPLYGLIAVAPFLEAAGQTKAQSRYAYTMIDVPGSIGTHAFGINGAGQVVGVPGFLLGGGGYTSPTPGGNRWEFHFVLVERLLGKRGVIHHKRHKEHGENTKQRWGSVSSLCPLCPLW